MAYLNAVLGFLFDDQRQQVVLLIRNSPVVQKGKLNGVGGKIETGERPIDAMVREFREEAGVDTEPSHWQQFATMQISPTAGGTYEGGEIHVFKCFNTEYLKKVYTATDEQIVVITVDQHANFNLVGGCRWLIPMALHDHMLKAMAVVV